VISKPQKPAPANLKSATLATDKAEQVLGQSSATAVPISPAPRSSFTTVQKGETLQDVAVRVYGSSDQLELLWSSNRDLLPRKDSPLRPGSVLRTPEEQE
jgi:nucleoid-associated protein YgaU